MADKNGNSAANLGFEDKLWKAADALRSNMDAAEYKHVVLGLIFLKYISDAFEERHASLEAEIAQGADPEDPDEYRAENIFWVPREARWATLLASAKLPTIGKIVDDAMLAIERANAHRQNNFDGILTGRIDFNRQDELPRDKLVNLINHFSSHFGLVSGPPGTLHQANRRHRSSPERRAGHRSRHCAPGAPLEAGPDLLRSSWRSRPSAAPWPLLRPLRAWRRRA